MYSDPNEERPCEGCKNPKPWARHSKKEALTGKYYEECNACFDSSIPPNPDVYFRVPYWDPNLCDYDDPSYDVNKGTFITSKAHKAFVMKKLGVSEAGDMVRGSRNFDQISHKYGVQSLRRSHNGHQ